MRERTAVFFECYVGLKCFDRPASLSALSHLHAGADEAEHADGSHVVEFLCLVQGFFKRHGAVDSGHDGIDTVVIDSVIAPSQSAAESGDRNVFGLAAVANTLHDFAEAALPVCASLACDDKVCAVDDIIKIDEVENCVDTGFQLGIQVYIERCAQAFSSGLTPKVLMMTSR